jgi:hypothetical protein
MLYVRAPLCLAVGRYGRSGYIIFNGTRSSDGTGTEDVVNMPPYLQVDAPAHVDTRGIPTSSARSPCHPDGPFVGPFVSAPPTADTGGSAVSDSFERRSGGGGRFGSCAFVWDAADSDHRVPQRPNASSGSESPAAGRTAGAVSAVGWKGSFHIDVRLNATGAPAGPFNLSLYLLDYSRWGTRSVIKVTGLESEETLSEAVLAEDFGNGTYFRFNVPAARSLRIRLHQVHSPSADREGWAPPPLASAVFIDFATSSAIASSGGRVRGG